MFVTRPFLRATLPGVSETDLFPRRAVSGRSIARRNKTNE
jgi:hypothetical protein